jgi:hypothetical protein
MIGGRFDPTTIPVKDSWIKTHAADQPDLVGDFVQSNGPPDRLNRRDWTASVSKVVCSVSVDFPDSHSQFSATGLRTQRHPFSQVVFQGCHYLITETVVFHDFPPGSDFKWFGLEHRSANLFSKIGSFV